MTRLPIRTALAAIAAVGWTIALQAGAGVATTPGLPDASASPPGANNWMCRPTHAHPHPVVLVHGLFSTAGGAWQSLSPALVARGYCVFALTYGVAPGDPYAGGVTRMEDSSAELAAFVTHVLEATGARTVDVVGHSEGTLLTEYYLKFRGGAGQVGRVVGLAPIYHGSTTWGINPVLDELESAAPPVGSALGQFDEATCAACAEFAAGSPFLKHLYADGVYAVPGVTYTSVMTRYDELVTPYTSGRIESPHATNIVLQEQCPADLSEHIGIVADPVAISDVLNALDPAHARGPACQVSVPVLTVLTGGSA